MPRSNQKVRIVNKPQHELSLRLIEAVKSHPNLFDSKRIDYRDIDLKKRSWKEVQEMTDLPTVEQCQKLWKTLRDRFIRETRTLEEAGSSPEMATEVRWPYYSALLFYKNCGRSPRTYMSTSRKSSSDSHKPNEQNTPGDEAAHAGAEETLSNPKSCASAAADPPSFREERAASPQAASGSVSPQAVPSNSACTSLHASETSLNSTNSSPPSCHAQEHQIFMDAVLHNVAKRHIPVSSDYLEKPASLFRSVYELQSNRAPQNSDDVEDEVFVTPAMDGRQKHFGLAQYSNQVGCLSEALDLSKSVPQFENRALETFLDERVETPLIPFAHKKSFHHLRKMNLRSPVFDESSETFHLQSQKPKSQVAEPTSQIHPTKRNSAGKESTAKRLKADEDELFSLSLLAVFRRMKPRQKSLLKVKIMQDLSDVEFGVYTDAE